MVSPPTKLTDKIIAEILLKVALVTHSHEHKLAVRFSLSQLKTTLEVLLY